MPVMAADGSVKRHQTPVLHFGDPACRISATVADTGEWHPQYGGGTA